MLAGGPIQGVCPFVIASLNSRLTLPLEGQMPDPEPVGFKAESGSFEMIGAQFRPPLSPGQEFGIFIPRSHFIAEPVWREFTHREQHVDVEIALVVLSVGRVDSDIDDHALLCHVRSEVLRQMESLLTVQFVRQCNLEISRRLRVIRPRALILMTFNCVPKGLPI